MSEATKAFNDSDLYDYPSEPVPIEKRRSVFNLSCVTAGLAVAMSTLYTGATLAKLLTFQDAIFAIVGGCLFLFLMAGLMGGIGADRGVTFSVLSRHAFGRFGSKLVGLLWAITLTGWYAWQCGFFGQTINIMYPDSALTQVQTATIWGGLLMMTTAIVGFKGLAILSVIAAPVILIIILWGSGMAFSQVGLTAIMNSVPAEPASVGVGITIVIGGWIVGAIMQPDVSRYSMKASHNWTASALAMVVFALANFAGMVMVKAAGTDNIMNAMVGLGMGVSSLLMVILAQWTSNDNNLYSASLGVSNIKAIPKWKISIGLGLIATAIAGIGITDFFVPFLVFLGVYIPPIGGIIFVDYYLLNKRESYQFTPSTIYRQINIVSVLSVILAGLIASQISWGVGAINSFVLGGVLYLLLMKGAASMHIDPYRGANTRHGDE